MNDKLLKLKQKKLRQKVSYLRTELEETALIFQDAIVEFEIEFGEFLSQNDPKGDHNRRFFTI